MTDAKMGFNGSRLKSARLYRGLTIAEVAVRTGISKQAISQFETGKNEPKSEVLMRICNVLNFPREFLYEKDYDNILIGETYFRATSAITNREKQQQIERVKYLVKIFLAIEELITFPKLNIYKVKDDFNHDMEELAQEVRKYWNLGNDRITNIIDIMERNGIIVNSFYTNSKNIDAYSQLQRVNEEDIAVVILGDDKESFYRRNFNAAHELGHILLDDFYHINDMDKSEYRDMENKMNVFAGALLIPKEQYKRDLQTASKTSLDFYIFLKKKYCVSAAALIVRARQLNELTNNQYQYLMKQLSQKGYRKCEPYDLETPLIKPRYIKEAMRMIIEEDGMDSKSFLNLLEKQGCSLSCEIIEEILGLEKGYLEKNDKSDNLIELKRRIGR